MLNDLEPDRLDLLWNAPGGPFSRRHRGPYRYTAFVPPRLVDVELDIPAYLASKLEVAAQAVADLNRL